MDKKEKKEFYTHATEVMKDMIKYEVGQAVEPAIKEHVNGKVDKIQEGQDELRKVVLASIKDNETFKKEVKPILEAWHTGMNLKKFLGWLAAVTASLWVLGDAIEWLVKKI